MFAVNQMASFVREVLSATGHLGEKEDLCAKAERLKGRVNELKVWNLNINKVIVKDEIKNFFYSPASPKSLLMKIRNALYNIFRGA